MYAASAAFLVWYCHCCYGNLVRPGISIQATPPFMIILSSHPLSDCCTAHVAHALLHSVVSAISTSPVVRQLYLHARCI